MIHWKKNKAGIIRQGIAAGLFLIANISGSGAMPINWQEQNIYQIITDRFYDGDAANNNADGNYDPAGHRGTSVHGGDFKGIEQKLDYIKSLGATAIWISPIVLNARGEFHGYAARDFYKVDPHWGTLQDLQSLVRAAHARGILVIDDIVVNHGGDLVYSKDPGYGHYKAPPDGYSLQFRDPARQYAPPFDLDGTNRTLKTLFHNHGLIGSYHNPREVELGELSGLDDFQTETDYVRQQMRAIYEYWIEQAGFDGFRIDTVKHVEMGFWQDWCPAVHAFAAAHGKPDFFMFGEVLSGSEALCGAYTGTKGGGPYKLDSVLDYPLFFAINKVFAKDGGNTKQIEEHYKAIETNYSAEAQMRLVTFLDNHDQPRFLSAGMASNDMAKLEVALAFLYTARGIPSLYYGTEQAFNGGKDPYDREDMFAGQFKDGPAGVDSFNMTHPLFKGIAQFNNFRRLYPALLTGEYLSRWGDPNGAGLLAYARRTADEEILVVINTAASARTLTNRATRQREGTVLVNLLNTNETINIITGSKTPPIAMPGKSAKIFIPQSDLKPLDPVIVASLPNHAATGVAPQATVTLEFSQPMDTNSVQAAFSISPSVKGAFTWSAGRDKLTFTPDTNGRGLADQYGMARGTNIVVRLKETAFASSSGKSFFAPYELMFSTASR